MVSIPSRSLACGPCGGALRGWRGMGVVQVSSTESMEMPLLQHDAPTLAHNSVWCRPLAVWRFTPRGLAPRWPRRSCAKV